MSSEYFSFQVLNLHGNGLSRLQHLTCMTVLKKLTVSFNELTRLDDISYMVMSDDLNKTTKHSKQLVIASLVSIRCYCLREC